MKKLLGITLTLLSLGFVGAPAAQAAELTRDNAAVTANATPQWQRDRYGRRNYRRRAYTVRRSRVVRYGRRLYRETYVVRYLPNGRTNTRLISRVRIG